MECFSHCSRLQYTARPGVHTPASADRFQLQSSPDREVWRVLSITDDVGNCNTGPAVAGQQGLHINESAWGRNWGGGCSFANEHLEGGGGVLLHFLQAFARVFASFRRSRVECPHHLLQSDVFMSQPGSVWMRLQVQSTTAPLTYLAM